jgi:hypothetical protein
MNLSEVGHPQTWVSDSSVVISPRLVNAGTIWQRGSIHIVFLNDAPNSDEAYRLLYFRVSRVAFQARSHTFDDIETRSLTSLSPFSPQAISIPSRSSSPNQAIKQRPGQYETAQPADKLSGPQVAKRPVEEVLRLALRAQGEDERRDEQRAYQVESETGVGLEAECAGGDAEQGGG